MGSIHDGHRKRLKDRFVTEGLSSFEDHNVLELLLFYAIPMKDVNPLAHALMQRFGSFDAVLDASVDELCTVEGVSEHTAVLISMLPQIFSRYWQRKTPCGGVRFGTDEFFRLLVTQAACQTVECVWLYLFDPSDRLIEWSIIFKGSVNSARLSFRDVITKALKKNASSIAVMHNHLTGSPYPSTDDIETTMSLHNVVSAIGVELKEHYVVAGGQVMPVIAKGEVIKVKSAW